MSFSSWTELIALLGSFVASAFTLLRYSLGQHRGMVDRFVAFLEDSVHRQEAVNRGFAEAIDRLTETVRENSLLITRLAERRYPGES
ncbi:MAG: hypothetical protein ABL949_11695 [Fimbriimonadaceae bacterium]